MTRLRRVNEWVAVHVTTVFGSMWTAYSFFLFGFLPLLLPHVKVTLLYWSNTVQLWSLPLIMTGTNLINRKSERQGRRQYEMIERLNTMANQMHIMLESQDQVVQTLLTLVQANTHQIDALIAKTDEIDSEIDAITARTSDIP